ncbi:MAG: Na(+)/H(+) antiporter subunit B [bacterium]
MKLLGFLIVLITGAVLIWATGEFPDWGDPGSPASVHVSPRYIEKTLEETSVPNAVTSVLADYRGFDTMFETTVIFAAGISCFMLLRLFGKERPETLHYRHLLTGLTIRVRRRKQSPEQLEEFEPMDSLWTPHDLILRTLCRFLIPFIQLFALYVIAHGHHSPGGGFQGGVILGASLILLAISQDMQSALKRIPERTLAMLAALGVSVYAGTGALCLVMGSNFLDYAALAGLFRVDPVEARSLGIFLVEVGVGIAVMATMILIYHNLASEGRLDEGL